MNIAFGCDPNAIDLMDTLIKRCHELGYSTTVLGTDDPIYANTAFAVAENVASGKSDRGVLLCGTGIGMSIAANKVQGAYAALISDVYSAERAIKSNNANIACIGAFTIGKKLALALLDTWLACKYDPNTPSDEKQQRYREYDMSR